MSGEYGSRAPSSRFNLRWIAFLLLLAACSASPSRQTVPTLEVPASANPGPADKVACGNEGFTPYPSNISATVQIATFFRGNTYAGILRMSLPRGELSTAIVNNATTDINGDDIIIGLTGTSGGILNTPGSGVMLNISRDINGNVNGVTCRTKGATTANQGSSS